jgi:hypothetical protein
VSERVQLSAESQPAKRRLGGWCEMAVSLGLTVSQSVEKSSVGEAGKKIVTRVRL